MKKTLLSTVLAVAASLLGPLYAQKTKTDVTFSIMHDYVNIRDFIHTPAYDMVLEMDNVGDFQRLRRFDSILAQVKREISFYSDSLRHYKGNVSIDYLIEENHDYRSIRFRKHPSNGELFVQRDGEPSRLKIERDTINIIMYVRGDEIKSRLKGKKTESVSFRPHYGMQITLMLNNYTDIDNVIVKGAQFRHIIDTLEAHTRKRVDVVNNPKLNQSSVKYNLTSDGREFVTSYKGILQTETAAPWNLSNRRDKLVLDLNAGLGLVRNTLTPMAEGGISLYNRRGYNNQEYNTYVTLTASAYFFFRQGGDGRFFTYDNWFVNISAGGAGEFMGIKSKLLMGGVGYLFSSKGGYFKNTTMKAFVNLKVRDGFTISPEVIFTNDFKQIFPGITVKVF